MTSNLGSDIIRESFEKINDDNREQLIEATQSKVFDLLKRSLRPEFVNRIDDLIMFQPLTHGNIRQIVQLQLQYLQKLLHKQNIRLTATDDALDYIAAIGFDPQFGARPIKRVIQKEVLNELSKEMLAGKVTTNAEVVLDMFDGQMVFRKPVTVV